MTDDKIRVSCNGFGVITLDDKLLGHQSKSRADKSITPFGGGYKYHPESEGYLRWLGAEFENNTRDLRLILPRAQIPAFAEWYFQRTGRETDPSRELEEELCDERQILDYIPSWQFREGWCVELQKPTTREGCVYAMTHYFFDFFPLQVGVRLQMQIRDAAEQPEGPVRLLSQEEIYAGKTFDGTAKIAQDLFRFSLGRMCVGDFKGAYRITPLPNPMHEEEDR